MFLIKNCDCRVTRIFALKEHYYTKKEMSGIEERIAGNNTDSDYKIVPKINIKTSTENLQKVSHRITDLKNSYKSHLTIAVKYFIL